MSNLIRYDDSATKKLFDDALWSDLTSDLEAARDTVLQDVKLFNSGEAVPEHKRPLDAGFIEFPGKLCSARMSGDKGGGPLSLHDDIQASAKRLRNQVDNLVLLGIGGSYMGLRALFDALCHPCHNELERDARGGAPRLYFAGENLDNDAVRGLLELLSSRCQDPRELLQRWGIVVISKSGGTLETASAFRIFRDALEQYYGKDSDDARNVVVPITGETGRLRSFANERGYPDVFPVPDGIGGRFSVLTAVGLYPAEVLGINSFDLLRGAADMTDRFQTAEIGDNPVLDYVATCHVCERHHGMTIRILSTWGKRLEAIGLWYDQLLSESLGKHERGATPVTAVNTRDLHSRGQQHQEGRRDKLITNVIVEQPSTDSIAVPVVSDTEDQDQLNRLNGKPVPELLTAAIQGTNKAYADAGRPTADIILPELDAYTVGQLLQMLMLATVVEGRLIDVNPYGQPGVEAYKTNMEEILYG